MVGIAGRRGMEEWDLPSYWVKVHRNTGLTMCRHSV